MTGHSPFKFSELAEMSSVIVGEIDDKEKLIELYSDALAFPYGSPNWDSFADCMTDLEWVTTSEIRVHHTHLPLAGDRSQQKIYLDILKDAVKAGEEHKSPVVNVSFVPTLQRDVESLG